MKNRFDADHMQQGALLPFGSNWSSIKGRQATESAWASYETNSMSHPSCLILSKLIIIDHVLILKQF